MRLSLLTLSLLPLLLAGCDSLGLFTRCRSDYQAPDLAALGRDLSAA